MANERCHQFGPPSSEGGMDQETGNHNEGQISPIILTERDKWKKMFELQHRGMMELVKAMSEPKKITTKIVLPEFNPDNTETDARAWCNTVDMCLKDNPADGSQLVVLLSRALKGSASTWLTQSSHPGVTWSELKDAFLARFDTVETTAATLFNVLSGNPKDGENMSTYVSRIVNTLTSRWQNMTVEEVSIAIALAHVARTDTQIQRLAFTTEIKTRTKLRQELMPFVYRKRSAPSSEKLVQNTDPKKPRLEPIRRCYNCGKPGHFAYECRGNTSKDSSTIHLNRSQSTGTNNTAQRKGSAAQKVITCYTCGEPGHIAPFCPQKEKKSDDREEPAVERRVNVCTINPATGNLSNLDDDGGNVTHEDV